MPAAGDPRTGVEWPQTLASAPALGTGRGAGEGCERCRAQRTSRGVSGCPNTGERFSMNERRASAASAVVRVIA